MKAISQLKDFLRAREMTQKEFAAEMGVNETTMSRWMDAGDNLNQRTAMAILWTMHMLGNDMPVVSNDANQDLVLSDLIDKCRGMSRREQLELLMHIDDTEHKKNQARGEPQDVDDGGYGSAGVDANKKQQAG